MANKNINGRLILKHDIEENWLKAVNFVPYKGEMIIYDIDDNYDYPRIKVGDGVTVVSSLPFAGDAYINKDSIGVANGVANLNEEGKIPESLLPLNIEVVTNNNIYIFS